MTGWVRTKPDYGRETDQLAAVGQDPIESIASAGSPRVHFRTGRVLYIDGFECGIQSWFLGTAGGGDGSIAWCNDYAFHGVACMKIIPSTLTTFKASAQHQFPFILSGLVGLEIAIWIESSSSDQEFQMRFFVTRDQMTHVYTLRLDEATKHISVMTGDSIYTDVLSYPFEIRDANPAFYLLKLVADTDGHAYETAWFNNNKIDLRALAHWSFAQNIIDQVSVQFHAYDKDGTQKPIYVDNFIYTINEEEF